MNRTQSIKSRTMNQGAALLLSVLVFLFSALPGQIHVLLCFDSCSGGFNWSAETHGECHEGLDCANEQLVEHAHDDSHAHHHESDVVLIGNDDLLNKKESGEADLPRLVACELPTRYELPLSDLYKTLHEVQQIDAAPPPDPLGLRTIILRI